MRLKVLQSRCCSRACPGHCHCSIGFAHTGFAFYLFFVFAFTMLFQSMTGTSPLRVVDSQCCSKACPDNCHCRFRFAHTGGLIAYCFGVRIHSAVPEHARNIAIAGLGSPIQGFIVYCFVSLFQSMPGKLVRLRVLQSQYCSRASPANHSCTLRLLVLPSQCCSRACPGNLHCRFGFAHTGFDCYVFVVFAFTMLFQSMLVTF